MKYVVLIYSNAASRKLWEQFSDAERGEGLAYYAGLDALLPNLLAGGLDIVVNALV